VDEPCAHRRHESEPVRAFAGTTPTDLIARLLPDGLGVSADRARDGR
jgi:hypothetical protein